jgi:YbbR domain-containing protein
LSLEKYETQNSVEDTEEIILKFKVDLESIELNEDIGVKLKLIDDKKKVIDSVKCQINIKKIKENKRKLPMMKRLIKTLIIIY